jgi:nucleoporin GLE1
LKKVKAYERRSFYESLDRIDSELEAQHNAALDKVAKLHDQVLEEAEETLRVHQRAVEEEARRKEEAASREVERAERARAEKLRREQEEATRREAERKAAEEARKKAEAEAERKRQAAQEEKERKERERLEDENRKRQAETQKAEQEAARLKAEATQKAQEALQKRVGGSRLTEEEVKAQARYVELHQHLKKFRQYLKDEGKANAIVKQNMGDIRRSIKKCVGQLREGKGTNKGQVRVITLFERS